MADLVLLNADIERIEETDAQHSSTANMASGASDTDDPDDVSEIGSDDGVAVRTSKLLRGAFTTVFSNPSNYDAATRAGRKLKSRRAVSSSRNAEGSARPKVRTRAMSNLSTASRESDLLLDRHLAPPADDANDTSFTIQPLPPMPTTPTLKRMHSRYSQMSPSHSRAATRGGLSNHGDEEEMEGVWGSNSDWAIDTRIMYKRRITAVFTVSQVKS